MQGSSRGMISHDCKFDTCRSCEGFGVTLRESFFFTQDRPQGDSSEEMYYREECTVVLRLSKHDEKKVFEWISSGDYFQNGR